MRVIYNGIDLMVLETHEFYAEAVYDDSMTDYLYTKFSLVVTALMNGQAQVVRRVSPNGPFMSYKLTGVGDSGIPGPTRANPTTPVPVIGPTTGIDRGIRNQLPRDVEIVPVTTPFTHTSVRHRLETPRGKLFVFSGVGMEKGSPRPGTADPPDEFSGVFLESPTLGTDSQPSCDCKNGPIPKVLGITAAMGDANTLLVDWSCETYVNEAGLNNASPRGALLSNRWKQQHKISDGGYTTIMTEGVAIFRTDLIYETPQSPDALRANLFIPIPRGFVREIDYVEADEAVTGIRYGYHDTQVPVNFVAGPYAGAMQISAIHRQAVTSDAKLLEGVMNLYQQTSSTLLNLKWLRAKDGLTPRGAGTRPLPGRLRVPGAGP